jgi:hypothetical protein
MRGATIGATGSDVLNEAISGNRVLNDVIGPNAQRRIDRDVLTQAGWTFVILLEGTNDMGFSQLPPGTFGPGVSLANVSAAEIIAGYEQFIARFHQHGQMTYRIGGFTAGSSRSVTLYFVEHFFSAAGNRVFDVVINGKTVLPGFDVLADAGGQYIAVKHTFTTTASSSGQVVIQFVTGAADNPIVNGIVVN